jgi:hypothetical protein
VDIIAYKGATSYKKGFISLVITKGEKGVIVSNIKAVKERGYY